MPKGHQQDCGQQQSPGKVLRTYILMKYQDYELQKASGEV